MLKKLALAVSCVYCCYLSADSSPFGISLGQTTVDEINQELIEKPVLSSLENMSEYSELFLRLDTFSINDCEPIMAKGFKNKETNTIDAIALEYSEDIMYELTTILDQYYVRTRESRAFFGKASEVEYSSGNGRIRIMKMRGHTILLYGTVQWLNSYDESRKQFRETRNMLKKIRGMKRDNAERMPQQRFEHNRQGTGHRKFNKFGRRNFRKDHPRKFFDESPWFAEDFANSFGSLFNDDFFKSDVTPIKLNKSLTEGEPSADTKTQTYSFSQSYSKVNDVEELKRNDNGDITEVVKTPEKITVTHNGVTKDISPEELKSAGSIVNLVKNSDPNCGIEITLEDANAKTTPSPKPESQCCCQPAEEQLLFHGKFTEKDNPDSHIKCCQPTEE